MVSFSTALVAAAASAAPAAAAWANCTREFLTDATSAYMHAQMHGIPSLLTHFLAKNVSYTENDTPGDISTGILSSAIYFDRIHLYYDTTQCGAVAEIIAASADQTATGLPYLIHTRMLFEQGPSAGMTLVQSVVTKPGDWAFNATGYLYYDAMESWPEIPEDQRDTRTAIQAAGDSYFERFSNASVVIPMASACARLEGGSYTARGNFTANTCDGYPSTIHVTNRRYIVDEVFGVVDIFIGFPMLDRSLPKVPMPDSHLFRVEHGKIRYIHTVSQCIHYNCGLNKTTFGQENAYSRSSGFRLSNRRTR